MNRRVTGKVKGQASERGSRLSGREVDKKNAAFKSLGVQKKAIVKRKIPQKDSLSEDMKKNDSQSDSKRKGVLKTHQISSTPIKAGKMRNPKVVDAELDSLSNISKSSSRSSVCSSVSSGLIELLCNYNSENLSQKTQEAGDTGKNADKDETLKNESTFTFVIPTGQPNCDGRLKLLQDLLGKLKDTANSIISSGDSKSVKRMEKIVETIQKEFDGLQVELPAIWVQKRELQAEIDLATAPLKNENASLQRKIRILNQNLVENEKKNGEKDINLELETVQCMNNTLMEQVKKLSSLLQELQGEKRKQEETIATLRRENKKLNEDLLYKNTEFTKSQEIFSTEAGTIKTEVADALRKVNALKRQLCEEETKGELMKVSLREKDDEIARLNDLNKGLQSSVSRLLEDLRKASRTQSRLTPSNEMSSAFLKSLQNVLDTPQRAPNHLRDASFLQKSFTKSFPPPTNKENFVPQHLGYIPPPQGVDEYDEDYFLSQNNFDGVLESSRLSSIQTEPPTSSARSVSTGMHFYENPKGSSATASTKPTMWEPSSVSSSFTSFTTRDENDFANGLALLDADIQRLQESLHDMSAKTN